MNIRERLARVEKEVALLKDSLSKSDEVEKTYLVSVSAITVAIGTSYYQYEERIKAFTKLLMKNALISAWVEDEHEGDIFCQGYDDVTINIHTTDVRIAKKFVAVLNAALPQAPKDERDMYEMEWNAQAVLTEIKGDDSYALTEEENWQIQ